MQRGTPSGQDPRAVGRTEGEEKKMRTVRIILALGLMLLVLPLSVPASAIDGEADWVDTRSSLDGTLEPMPDLASPASRQGQGTMMSNFEDEKWSWRASGSGTCTEIRLDIVATYPPRPGDWARASGIAKADDAMHNFCTPGTRRFQGKARILGGGGNYAKAEGEFPLTGVLIGDGPTSRETVHIDAAGKLRCYHVGSVADRRH
jgi:hypothetical protein